MKLQMSSQTFVHDFGLAVRQLREARGWSQEMLASHSDLHRTYVGEVERADQVTIKGYDANGKPVRIKAYDYLARIFFHEIDHLDGILFIDRLVDVSKLRRLVRDPDTDEVLEEPVPAIPTRA